MSLMQSMQQLAKRSLRGFGRPDHQPRGAHRAAYYFSLEFVQRVDDCWQPVRLLEQAGATSYAIRVLCQNTPRPDRRAVFADKSPTFQLVARRGTAMESILAKWPDLNAIIDEAQSQGAIPLEDIDVAIREDTTFELWCYTTDDTQFIAAGLANTSGKQNQIPASDAQPYAASVPLEKQSAVDNPRSQAVLHIKADTSTDLRAILYYNGDYEPITISFDLGPFSLKDPQFNDGHNILAEKIKNQMRYYSSDYFHDLVKALEHTLDGIPATQPFYLFIFDETEHEFPWEMLTFDDGQLLGARVIVVRESTRDERENDLQARDCVGIALSYVDTDETLDQKVLQDLNTIFQEHAVESKKDISTLKFDWRPDISDQIGLIHLYCHITLESDRETDIRCGELDYAGVRSLELPNSKQRPIIFVNGCRSAVIRKRGNKRFGLPIIMMKYLCKAYIGTFSPVNMEHASSITKQLLPQAYSKDGVQIAEFLRQMRSEAFEQYEKLRFQDKEQLEQSLQKLVHLCVYTYYGNPFVRLKLTKAENDHDKQ